jgi:hypothetical protein
MTTQSNPIGPIRLAADLESLQINMVSNGTYYIVGRGSGKVLVSWKGISRVNALAEFNTLSVRLK